MIKSRAIASYKGIMSRVGITAQIGIGGGGGSSGSLFDGTYAFYPFATNGNNTASAGVKINERLDDKIFNNDSGDFVTVNQYETAYTGSGELDEPDATNSAEPDLLNWTPRDNVIASAADNDFTAIQVLNDSANQPMLSESASVASLTGIQTFSVFADKGSDDLCVLGVFQSTPSTIDSTAVFNLETEQVVTLAAGFEGGGVEKLNDNLWRVYVSIDVTLITGNITLKVKCTNSASNSDYTIGTVRKAKFANLVEGSYPTSYIDTLDGTRDSDKAAVPTSDVYIDNNHELTESGGIVSLAGTKYDGLFNNKIVGAYFVDANQIKAQVTAYSSNELTVNGPIENTFLALHYSTLTLAECKKLREDAKDVPDFQLPVTSSYQVDPQWSSSEASINGNVVNINLDTGGGVEDVIDVTLSSTSLTEIEVGTVASTMVILERISGAGDIYFPGLEPLTEGVNSTFFTFTQSPSLPYSGSLIAVDGAIECKITIVSYKIYRWLDWPAEDVVFELDFTLYSDDPNELFHIEWANAAKDTYVARTGDALEFNHGNDTLSIPYASLIVLGETYTGYAVITPTELIGFVNGIEVARMTRLDTQLAEWTSKCGKAGFNDTLAPVKLANFKVMDYTL